MNRRNFFSNIFSSNISNIDKFFFGLQLAIKEDAEPNFREKLLRIVYRNPEKNLPNKKRSYYTRIIELIEEAFNGVQFGFWDYAYESEDALNEFVS